MFPLLLLACRPPDLADPARPPAPAPESELVTRILLVSIDTLRADHLGAWGDARGLTPSLDAFAERSLRFSRAHAHAPWTKASMGSLMTSLLPSDHGVVGWNTEFAPGQVTLATTLHDAGWATEAYVSHLAFTPQGNEFEVGFDHFELSWKSQEEQRRPEQLETSVHLTELALPALERLLADEAPFFLWVHYLDPHRAYLRHDEWMILGDDDASRYAVEVAWTDRELGRLLEVAERDPSLAIVVLADHGEEFLDHGGQAHGHTLYEELLHVPLMLRAPGVAPGVEDTAVGTLDVAPTLLQLAGLPAPPSFQGLPLLPAPAARPVLSEVEWAANKRSVLDWPYKLVWDVDEGRGELYQLQDDPDELHNLFGEQPERAGALLQLLSQRYPEVPLTP